MTVIERCFEDRLKKIAKQKPEEHRQVITWIFYASSAVSFLLIFANAIFYEVTMFDGWENAIINFLFFVPAGFVSLGVRKFFFNLIMALGGVFLVAWRLGAGDRGREAALIEGSAVLVSLYCLLGILMAVAYAVHRVWVRKDNIPVS